jgi:hypothetical protein
MLKKIALGAALVFLPTLAIAAETPTSAEQCYKMLDEASGSADPAKFPEDVVKRVDELMSKAEGQCEAGQYGDAVQSAEAIKAALTAKN